MDFKVPYITTIQAAVAAADAIETMKKGQGLTIKSINEYHKEMEQENKTAKNWSKTQSEEAELKAPEPEFCTR